MIIVQGRERDEEKTDFSQCDLGYASKPNGGFRSSMYQDDRPGMYLPRWDLSPCGICLLSAAIFRI